MNLALNTAPARAALVIDVDALLERLPPTERARVAWAKPPIAEALGRLQVEPVAEALLDEIMRTIAVPLQTLGRTILELMHENPELLRAAVMDDFARELGRVESYVNDADAVDTARWAFGFLRSFFNATLPLLSLVQPSELDGLLSPSLEDSKLIGLMRGHIALMGSVEAAKSEAPRELVIELIEVAFLQLMRTRDHLRQLGVWISPFPEETTEQRRHDALRYADRLREILTADDWKNFEQARFGDLR